MKTVYLDNSATTAVYPQAADTVNTVLRECYGNPSSLHTEGMKAQQIIDDARKSVAATLYSDTKEIIFTSGGTESNNIAIQGAINALKRRGKRIITTSIEHPSVLNVFKEFEKQGFEAIYIKPDKTGKIDTADMCNAVTPDTILISCMLVNNETGHIQNIKELKRAILNAGSPALVHTDAVQAYGKIKINPSDLGADLISLSGHKIHAPKGIGALYIKKGVRILPVVFGGGQENNMRSGTENTAYIAGLCTAAQIKCSNIISDYNKVTDLNLYLRNKLQDLPCKTVINSPEDGLPYILNFSVPGYRSETMLHFLESKNIYLSSGSACSSRKGASYVLKELGLADYISDSALRVSFCSFNEKDEIDLLINAITEAEKTLIKGRF